MTVETASVVSSVITSTDITFYLSIAAALISLATFTVGYSQMKIASAKVKLDLYNKRFNVYLSALEYYQAMWKQTDDDLKQKGAEFIKCYRESLFLFSTNDGVHEILTRIKNSGGVVSTYENLKQADSGVNSHGPNMDALFKKSVEAREKIGDDLQALEKQLEKYIDFRVVDGWSFWWQFRWIKRLCWWKKRKPSQKV
jgi:hypothetical protein